jgi:hypothetical protein
MADGAMLSGPAHLDVVSGRCSVRPAMQSSRSSRKPTCSGYPEQRRKLLQPMALCFRARGLLSDLCNKQIKVQYGIFARKRGSTGVKKVIGLLHLCSKDSSTCVERLRGYSSCCQCPATGCSASHPLIHNAFEYRRNTHNLHCEWQ